MALTIVGIARAEFVGVRTDSVADLWVPLTLQDSLGYSTNRSDYGSSGREQAVDGRGPHRMAEPGGAGTARQTGRRPSHACRTQTLRGCSNWPRASTDARERASTMSTIARGDAIRAWVLRSSFAIRATRCTRSPRWSGSSCSLPARISPICSWRARPGEAAKPASDSHLARPRPAGASTSGRESAAGGRRRRDERARCPMDQRTHGSSRPRSNRRASPGVLARCSRVDLHRGAARSSAHWRSASLPRFARSAPDSSTALPSTSVSARTRR